MVREKQAKCGSPTRHMRINTLKKYTITNPSAKRHSRWLNKRSNEREVVFARARPAWFTFRIKDGWVKRYI